MKKINFNRHKINRKKFFFVNCNFILNCLSVINKLCTKTTLNYVKKHYTINCSCVND